MNERARTRLAAATLLAIGTLACSPPPPPSMAAPEAIPTQEVGKRALFGYKVAVSDDQIAVGAPHAKVAGYRKAGTVLLFDRATLALQRKIDAPDPTDGALFGFSLDLEGDRLLVGAVGHETAGVALAGAAYLFDSNTGRLLHSFAESPPLAKAEFGSTVTFAGSALVIGSPASTVDGETRAGAAYQFDASTGQRMHVFRRPQKDLVLGQALAFGAGRVLVGAPAATVNGVAHAGQVFAFDPATAKLTRTFEEPVPGAGSTFGAAIATDDDTVVIGAPNAFDRAGAAYVYDLESGALLHRLHEGLSLEDDGMFGYSLALLENEIAVGAPHTTVKGIPGSGAVYLFDRTSGRLVNRLTVRPVGGADLGISVAAEGGALFSSAQGGPEGGTVYVSREPRRTAPPPES